MPDPLPSWNEGAPREAVLDFVARATSQSRTGRRPVLAAGNSNDDIEMLNFTQHESKWAKIFANEGETHE